MAEAIIRGHKRRVDRWMPKKKRGLSREKIRAAGTFVARAVPGYLLAFAELLGIPSGLHAAYGTALAASGGDVRPVLLSGLAAMVIRLLSGLAPRWEMLLTLVFIAAAPLAVNGRSTWRITGYTTLSLLPTGIAAFFAPTAAQTLQGWAAVGIAVLSAPVMVRALKAINGQWHISSMEARIAVGYLAAMCLCGGARMMLAGINLGILLGAGATLAAAMTLGVGAGVIAGMLAGATLMLQGAPAVISVALALGACLAGVAASLNRRQVSCGFFASGAWLMLLLSGANDFGCGPGVLAATVGLMLLPRQRWEQLQRHLRRLLPNDPVPGDAYAADALHAWEQTISAMARAVPSPRQGNAQRDGEWWQTKLCQDCPACEGCGCLLTELGVAKAETAWEFRFADEKIWQDALEHLRGMGCQRLYHLKNSMNALRREDEAARLTISQAEMRRSMLLTHLTALSGAARRFASLSGGENWWDYMAARRIRGVLAERAIPAALSYVRRVQGHIQAAFELQFITGARKQAEELAALVDAVLDVPMEVAAIDGDRVLLKEMPLLQPETGAACAAITGGKTCGDTSWSGRLQDGRYLAALSDGMGHGENAAMVSRQTVELLRLCLDAGYNRQQTLIAVNGMMLLGGEGERFATADVLTIDLWQGHAALDKLGAAASWVCCQGELTRFTGDTLPLGILEDIDLNGSTFRLQDGDAVVLLSDGVEDAFCSTRAMEAAIQRALADESPQTAAESILASALEADDGQRRDDQSVMVVYIRSSARALQRKEAAV